MATAPSQTRPNNPASPGRAPARAPGARFSNTTVAATSTDYDGDGWLDIFKTNFSEDTSTLYHNASNAVFDDVTFAVGIGTNTRWLGWGCGFVDIDNDGWPDIFVSNGHIYPEIDRLA